MLFSSQSSKSLTDLTTNSHISTSPLSTTTRLTEPLLQRPITAASNASTHLVAETGIIVGGSPTIAQINPGKVGRIGIDDIYIPNRVLLGDDTKDMARDLGHLTNSTVYTFKDYVGYSDKSDFYQFTIDDVAYVSMALTGLNATADLSISIGDSVAQMFPSVTPLMSDRLYKMTLGPGTYYVAVKSFGSYEPDSSGFHNTDYTLRFQCNTESATRDDPTLLSARNDLGLLRGTRNFSAQADVSSFANGFGFSSIEQYHFNLANVSDLSVSINNSKLYLIQDANNNGIVDPGEMIGTSQAGSQPLSLTGLSAGSYFLQISSVNKYKPTAYNLNLTATPSLNSTIPGLNLEPNDTLNQSIDIGNLIGQRSFSNTIGGTDKNDFYRFNLGSPSNLNLSLSGLTANADVQVIRDVNHNGIADQGDVVASSARGGTAAESIDLQGLDQGFYFVRVSGNEGTTNYTLNLTGTPGLGLAPEANDTLATAHNLGTLNTLRQFNGFVGWSDPDDYYRFTLGTSRQVDLLLGGMSAFADLQLLDRNGAIVASDSAYSGHMNLAISRSLAAGDYIVRVKHYEDPDYFPVNQDTQYQLRLAA